MNPHDPKQEQLVGHMDGPLSEAEADQVAASLRHDPEARRFLREMAEQAVMIADVEREAQGRRALLQGNAPAVPAQKGIAGFPAPSRRFTAVLAVAASMVS
jgi:anti-sigma factor RsiW